MARKEVSLFLKHPGPSHALQRLTHSFLECVVDFKRCTALDLSVSSPAELRAEYQLKGTATLVEDEIVMQFVPKHAGVHVARIFADTREICRPVAFRVTRNCEVEGLALDRPVVPRDVAAAAAAPLLPPLEREAPQDYVHEYAASLASAPPAVQQQQQQQHPRALGGADQPHPPISDLRSEQQQQQRHFGEPIRGFTSDSSLHVRQPESFQRASYLSSNNASRPTSTLQDDSAYAGDLFTAAPGGPSSFGQLHAAMRAGESTYGKRKGGLVLDHASTLTPEVLRLLSKDIDGQIARQLRGKKTKRT